MWILFINLLGKNAENFSFRVELGDEMGGDERKGEEKMRG